MILRIVESVVIERFGNMKKSVKILIAAGLILIMLWLGLSFGAAWYIVRPHPRSFGDDKTLAGKAVEPVTVRTEDGISLSAWYLQNTTNRGVLLMHGYTADRRQLEDHAEYYFSRGYSVLMTDERAAGRSEGSKITFGYDERKDVAASIGFLREKGCTFVGAHGISLGAAAICYLMPEKPALDFIVLESAYDTIEHAFINRTRLVKLPDFLGVGARVFASWMMGHSPAEMRPVESIRACTVPALILGGDSEQYLFVSETQSIFDNCASASKKMHIFKGARHEIFIHRYEAEFKQILGDFLATAEK